MKRLILYFHYDGQGILDEPCRIALQAMQAQGELVLVTNGSLAQESRSWAECQQIRLMERENRGLDVGAYRHGLMEIGRDALQAYEELVLMNFTLAGPVCPLETMFRTMEGRSELDFWGLTRHYAMRSRRFGGQVPEHLQSHFLAMRASLFRQDCFWEYWQQMPLPKSYEESVTRHETRFTAYFAERGFCWDSYVDTADLKEVFVNPIMACPRELIQNRGCPFFKRRSFFTPYADELRRTDGNAAAELQHYLRCATAFPVDALLRSLLRTQPLDVLSANLHWQYVVADEGKGETPDLAAEGLRLLRFAPLQAEPVTRWYLSQSACTANTLLAQAAALFRSQPLLGVLSPALPPWPKALQAVRADWAVARERLRKEFAVPVGSEPPPAPCAGWVLVRETALPGLQTVTDLWSLPLQAQQNGYYSATFETACQASTRAEQLRAYMAAAEQPRALAKQLGRLGKHALLH